MKISVSVGIGIESRQEILEIPDEELVGLSQAEIDKVCDEYYSNWGR